MWAALIDLERVAPCLPGAAITGHDEEGTYHREFKVKLGPTTASYRGTVKIVELDEAAHRATMRAKGTDKRGQGGASATIVNMLMATEGGGTRVDAVTEYAITARLASFGRGGMIQDISNRLLGTSRAACRRSSRRSPHPQPGPSPSRDRRSPHHHHHHHQHRRRPSRSTASGCPVGSLQAAREGAGPARPPIARADPPSPA